MLEKEAAKKAEEEGGNNQDPNDPSEPIDPEEYEGEDFQFECESLVTVIE